jgi:hypothetical protein
MRPRDLQSSPHPAGERRDRADHGQHLLHPRRDQRALDAVELSVQAQVLGRAQVSVEGRVLEDEADVAADVVALGGDVEAGDARAPAGGTREGAEDVDRGGLPGTVGAEEAEHLAAADLEAHAPHRRDVAERLAQVGDGDCGVRIHGPSL